MSDHTEDWASLMLDGNGLARLGPESRAGARLERECRDLAAKQTQALGIPSDKGQVLLAALLLWNDHLGASHSISQSLHGADGSLLHGWMHRREPDYFNAKYWVRQTGRHPLYPALAEAAAAALDNAPDLRDRLVKAGCWDAGGMVEAVEAALGGRRKEWIQPLQEVQRLEVLLLLRSLG